MRFALICTDDCLGLDEVLLCLSGFGYCVVSSGNSYEMIREAIVSKRIPIGLMRLGEFLSSSCFSSSENQSCMKSGGCNDISTGLLSQNLHDLILHHGPSGSSADEGSGAQAGFDVVCMGLGPMKIYQEKSRVDSDCLDISVDLHTSGSARAGESEFIGDDSRIDDAYIVDEKDYIGKEAIIRASIANHENVLVLTSKDQYGLFISAMESSNGNVPSEIRNAFAVSAAEFLADINDEMAVRLSRELLGKESLRLSFSEGRKLGRYGENWHQSAWLYARSGLAMAEQLSGICMGYNNYIDADRSFKSLLEIGEKPSASVVKQSNLCGYATGKTLRQAIEMAWQGDEISAHGCVVAFSGCIGLDTARFFDDKFVEVMVLPGIEKDALEYLRSLKKNMRILKADLRSSPDYEFRSVDGGILRQTSDDILYLPPDPADLLLPAKPFADKRSGTDRISGVVTGEGFPSRMLGLVEFSVKASRHVKSNAVVICYEYRPGYYMLLGAGCGQPNRMNAISLAVAKAIYNLRRMYDEPDIHKILSSDRVVLCSDAFFPFIENIELIAKSGIKHVVQSGGSLRDTDIISAADNHSMAMLFTGTRHLRH